MTKSELIQENERLRKALNDISTFDTNNVPKEYLIDGYDPYPYTTGWIKSTAKIALEEP